MTSDGFHDRATSQADKAAGVRAMFDAIAPRYDLFNDVLSAGIHRRWRQDAVELLAPRSDARYLDLCAGTLDLAKAIAARAPGARIAGADFSLPMLAAGRAKLARA
jgi:demethylmenaquinone methyltransferase/2-methoxy-6-polyprenyl-1,4-benzoquinol methylase